MIVYDTYKKVILLVMLLFFTIITIDAQQDTLGQPTEFRNWGMISLNFRISKSAELKYYQLYSLNTSPYHLKFIQNAIGAQYRISKNFRTNLFLSETLVYNNSGTRNFNHTLHSDFRHTAYAGDLSIRNTLAVQWYLPTQKKYQYRVYHALRVKYANNHWPLRISPYMEFRTYYFNGGDTIRYYDNDALLVAEHQPNGIHRYRFKSGFSFRPAQNITVGAFYMLQREFNLNTTSYNQLNVYDPVKDKIQSSFKPYNVLALTLSFRFKSDYNAKNKEEIETEDNLEID